MLITICWLFLIIICLTLATKILQAITAVITFIVNLFNK